MKKLSVEEYMRTLLRIGFAKQFVLEKCYEYSYGSNLTNLDDALTELEAAAKACGIHSEDAMRSGRSSMERGGFRYATPTPNVPVSEITTTEHPYVSDSFSSGTLKSS